MKLRYFLRPSELFSSIAKCSQETHGTFILDILNMILKKIDKSPMGTESEDGFCKLYEHLISTKTGRKEKAKNEMIGKVCVHLDQVNFQLENREIGV